MSNTINFNTQKEWRAKILDAQGEEFFNDKPFIMLEFGTWSAKYWAYRDVFSMVPVFVDLTELLVPAGEKIPASGYTKLLILEKI